MGQHVARAQQVEDLRHELARLDAADVAHHLGRRARELAGADGAAQRLQAVARDHVIRHAHLDADHDVGVFAHRLGGRFGLREVDVEELGHREAAEADVGDVHEGVEARARLRDDVAAEDGEVVGARVARRHRGGGALERHQLVGRNADRRAVGEDMRVEVDQARHHQAPGGVQHARRARRRNVRFDRLDHAVAHAHVAPAAQALARIEHFAALDHQVELVVRPHRGARADAGECGGNCRADAGDDAPALEGCHGHSSQSGIGGN